jgi:lipopolysaccharide transport system ATP-binding protein
MKDDVILKIENLSKQYRLGLVGTGTISHDFNRFLARIRGKEDPYLKIGESNDRSTKGTSEYVWALKNINFEVKRGEILGIIGKNGAGKSTLLKILSKVTGPTTGAIKSKGRIASLLEVGTGFHPEMTGKENIFLNGAILGMTKKEIASKLDEIIQFSGCERYVETPVKRYSSGMKVRLAFAVAAFLEPDILVVDEVLAVGDAEFQKKAIGKMQDISSQGGRTVLFVSHDMAAIKSLCYKSIVLNNGRILFEGEVSKAIDKYLQSGIENSNDNTKVEFTSQNSTFIREISLKNHLNNSTKFIEMGQDLIIDLILFCSENKDDLKISVLIVSSSGEKITAIRSHESTSQRFQSNNPITKINIRIKELNLMPKDYYLTFALAVNGNTIETKNEVIKFSVFENDVFNTGKIPKGNFINYYMSEWSIE